MSVRMQWETNADLDALAAAGVDLAGLYVVRREPEPGERRLSVETGASGHRGKDDSEGFGSEGGGEPTHSGPRTVSNVSGLSGTGMPGLRSVRDLREPCSLGKRLSAIERRRTPSYRDRESQGFLTRGCKPRWFGYPASDPGRDNQLARTVNASSIEALPPPCVRAQPPAAYLRSSRTPTITRPCARDATANAVSCVATVSRSRVISFHSRPVPIGTRRGCRARSASAERRDQESTSSI
jgi:hypothetical protein